MPDEPVRAVQRADQWLWFARFVKTRTLAQRLIVKRKVRVKRTRTTRPAPTVLPGDIVSFMAHDHVKVVEVLAIGTHRGPATEARYCIPGSIQMQTRHVDELFHPTMPYQRTCELDGSPRKCKFTGNSLTKTTIEILRAST